MKNLYKTITSLTLFSLLLTSINSLAYTSIATVPGHVSQAFYRTSNYESQKEADAHAIEGCRVEAREKGIGQLAKKCVVKSRATGPGYGAVVFAEDGAAWVTGYSDNQVAVDAAYAECEKAFRNCQKDGISYWLDEAGFKKKSAPKTASLDSCTPPSGKTLRYADSCVNGDCVRTFENGCKKRFQAAYCYDAIQGRYDWKPNGC